MLSRLFLCKFGATLLFEGGFVMKTNVLKLKEL